MNNESVHLLSFIYYLSIDEFEKIKVGRKREFEAALAIAKEKKAKLEEVERAEKKYLEETQKRNYFCIIN